MESGIPAIDVVVVLRDGAKVFGSSLLVEPHQPVRIPVFAPPKRHDILVSEFGRMAIALQVILVLRVPLNVHVARVPVAHFRNRFRSPAGPESQLGIAKPFGGAISLERIEFRRKAYCLTHRREQAAAALRLQRQLSATNSLLFKIMVRFLL